MLHLSLRQWEVFCAIAQSGSTVAAADAMGLSQSAVSAALQQLENPGNRLTAQVDHDGQLLVRGCVGNVRALVGQLHAQDLQLGADSLNGRVQPEDAAVLRYGAQAA